MTYQPELYDLVTPATLQDDVDWYCRQAKRSGGPVLELGAGTGRVTLPIAVAGVALQHRRAVGQRDPRRCRPVRCTRPVTAPI